MHTESTSERPVSEKLSGPPLYDHLAGRLLGYLDARCTELAHEALKKPHPGELADPAKRKEWSDWWGLRDSDQRVLAERALSLAKVRILVAAGVDPSLPAVVAKHSGATWAELGDAAGISRQAAQSRWKDKAEQYTTKREHAEDERRKLQPFVSPVDEYDPEGKGMVGEATRSRRRTRKSTDEH